MDRRIKSHNYVATRSQPKLESARFRKFGEAYAFIRGAVVWEITENDGHPVISSTDSGGLIETPPPSVIPVVFGGLK